MIDLSCDEFWSICEAKPRSIYGLTAIRYARLRLARYVPFHGTFWGATGTFLYAHSGQTENQIVCSCDRFLKNRTAFDLFYPIRMAGFGTSALIFTPNMAGQNRGKRQEARPFISIARLAGKYRVCCQANISTERLGENGNFFYPSFCHGRTGCAFRHPGGAAALSPQVRPKFRTAEFRVWPENYSNCNLSAPSLPFRTGMG